jgi:hypothetical protein
MTKEPRIDRDLTGVEEDVPVAEELIGLDGKAHLYPSWMVHLLRLNHDCAVQSGRPPILAAYKRSGKDRILPAAKVALAAILDVPYYEAEGGDLGKQDITDITVEDVLEIGVEVWQFPGSRDGLLARLKCCGWW